MGIRGLVPQDAPTEMLFKSVRCVSAGQYWIGRERVGDVLDYFRRRNGLKAATVPDRYGLTLRDKQIIRYVIKGYQNTEIAQYLVMTNQAVRHRLSRIFAKLGVCNRLELALFGLEKALYAENAVSPVFNELQFKCSKTARRKYRPTISSALLESQQV